MTQEEAIRLIEPGVPGGSKTPQVWADIGCGTGTFTKALAALLPAGSVIHAIDSDRAALNQVPDQVGEVRIERIASDFHTSGLPLLPDGILMGNFLHFVQEKETFLKDLHGRLKSGGVIILIEYDTDASNTWVPYPISMGRLESLALSSGFRGITKIGGKSSLYQAAPLYTALLKK